MPPAAARPALASRRSISCPTGSPQLEALAHERAKALLRGPPARARGRRGERRLPGEAVPAGGCDRRLRAPPGLSHGNPRANTWPAAGQHRTRLRRPRASKAACSRPSGSHKLAQLEADRADRGRLRHPQGAEPARRDRPLLADRPGLWHDFAAAAPARRPRRLRASTVSEFLVRCCATCSASPTSTAGAGMEPRRAHAIPSAHAARGGRVPVVVAAHDQRLDKPDAALRRRQRPPPLALQLAQEYLNASRRRALGPRQQRPHAAHPARQRQPDPPGLGRGRPRAHLRRGALRRLRRPLAARPRQPLRPRPGRREPADCPWERWRSAGAGRRRPRPRAACATASRRPSRAGHGLSRPPGQRRPARRRCKQANAHEARPTSSSSCASSTASSSCSPSRSATCCIAAAMPRPRRQARSATCAGYSLACLRDRAARAAQPRPPRRPLGGAADHLRGLASGEPRLGLPALGGLFDADQCPDLDAAQLENRALLAAVFQPLLLPRRRRARPRQLARHGPRGAGQRLREPARAGARRTSTQPPAASASSATTSEGSTKGNARKPTGSYYTPDSLVQVLLNSALEPVIAQTPARPTRSSRSRRCSSSRSSTRPAARGHFLLAAARRLADEVARAARRRRHPTPGRLPPRPARRGRPLHLRRGPEPDGRRAVPGPRSGWKPSRPAGRSPSSTTTSSCGDALLGVLDPAMLEARHPGRAFKALSGDDKAVATALKKAQPRRAQGHREGDGTRPPVNLDASASTPRRTPPRSKPCRTTRWPPSKPSAPPLSSAEAQSAASRARLAADLCRRLRPAQDRRQRRARCRPARTSGWCSTAAQPAPRRRRGCRPRLPQTAQRLPLVAGLPAGAGQGRLRCAARQPAVGAHQAAGGGVLRRRSPLVADGAEQGRARQRIDWCRGMLLHTLPGSRGGAGLIANAAEHALYAEFIAPGAPPRRPVCSPTMAGAIR